MSVLRGALGMGRRQAEARMTETVTVFRVERGPASGGVITDVEVPVHEDVPARVKFPSLTVSERAQGGQVPAVQDVQIHVPVGATPDVVVNDLWRVTASTVDPGLVGRVFRTKGEPEAGQVTAHRWPVERVS